jgi:flagellin
LAYRPGTGAGRRKKIWAGKDASPQQNDKEINIMRIQHNIMAMNAYRNYNNNTSSLSGNLEKLSSGYKINRAGDDAAGLAISEKMRAQISGLEQASSNVKDGVSLVKTGEGAMQEIQDMLNRMVTLATQSANGTYDETTDRTNLQKEVTALKSEIDRIADSSNFNGIALLDGTQAVTTKATTFGSAASKATVTLTFSGVSTGKDLIGGTITIGTYSFEFKQAQGANATKADSTTASADADKGVVYVKSNTALENILSAITTAINSGAAKGKDVDNNELKFDLESTATTLKLTATTSASLADLYQPTANVNAGLSLQIGDTSDGYNKMRVGITDMHVESLGINNISIGTQEDAAEAVNKIKAAINTVSGVRGDLGAIQNRLEHTQNNLSVMTENIQDAESTIRDTDVAEEMMSYTKNNILVQSAQAMLAQANSVPQGVLQLLQ